MDTNLLVDLVHGVQDRLWVDKVNEILGTDRFCEWVSTHHPDNLPCEVHGTNFYNGSFNAGLKVVFSDSTAWMVRFPRVGPVCGDYADEKIAMEVTALDLLRNKTTIPVPRVHAWGSAANNSLGLGPFIMMDFIEGVSLCGLLGDPNADEESKRLMREDVSENDIETLYRQMANFLLQIFELDFDRIGSLPSSHAKAPLRPLTFKVNNILQDGGVDTFGDRAQGFATSAEYFQYLVGQDWDQLIHQPNSTFGLYYSQGQYVAFKVLKSVIPDMINTKYDRGKFKLICDDFGLGNLIVRSKEDLTVVGVVDLEWSYIGPAQLLGSAPWWLLRDRPVNPAWDCEDDEPPKVAARYFKYLDIFMRILEEEEAKMPGHEEKEFSSLVKWSQTSGAMWVHMLLSAGFIDDRTFPFTQLRLHLGDEWARRKEEFKIAEETEAFAARKLSELEKYEKTLEEIQKKKALVDSGDMTKEEFLADPLAEITIIRCSSKSNEEVKNGEVLLSKVTTWLGWFAAKLKIV